MSQEALLFNVHFSSETDEWATPKWLFTELNYKYSFTLDPCCTEENAKCDKYYTKEDNGLDQDWSNEVVFMNPPYGRDIKFSTFAKNYISEKIKDYFSKENNLNGSDRTEKIHNVWPINIGEFFNPEHVLIKDELINFFKEYEKMYPQD